MSNATSPSGDAISFGIAQPSVSGQHARDGSHRRATHIDVARPDGLDGHLEVYVAGRDVDVIEGVTHVRADCRLTVWISSDGVVEEFAGPDGLDLIELEGVPITSGFRRRAAGALGKPDDPHRRLAGALLDDLPAAVFVSGYARGRAGRSVDAAAHTRSKVDICAGWRRDGAMMGYIESTGRLPMPVGPVAPDLDVGDRRPATLELPKLPVHALRRRRRIDMRPGRPARVDSMFRDSHMTADEVETVLHEYGLRVSVDPRTGGIVSARAEPRVLPWPECGDAAASAKELVGRRLTGLARAIRSELTGPSTCTHLNDLMRALEGIEHLATPDVSTQPRTRQENDDRDRHQ